MESQMTASEGGVFDDSFAEGYFAVIQTKSCLVFQLNRDVKSRPYQPRAKGKLEEKWHTSVEVKFNTSIFLFPG